MPSRDQQRPGRGAVRIAAARDRRKVIAFEPEVWQALDQLARDSMRTIQELADEAFADLLKKHRRPSSFREALRDSARHLPANDARPGRRR